MIYLNPTNDLVFKKLFGTDANKDLLISFLNGILERRGDKLITDEDISDKWIYFLRHAADCENPPQELQKTQSLIKAFDVLERGRWTRQELEDYEKSVDARRVEESQLETAEARGEKKERDKIAREMLAENANIEFICKVTGLSLKEVEALSENEK